MPAPKPDRVHIQDTKYLHRALCGEPWEQVIKGGRIASDGFEPPVVQDKETGSTDAATCKTCLAVWRRRLASKI
jgi:hypothetical protein